MVTIKSDGELFKLLDSDGAFLGLLASDAIQVKKVTLPKQLDKKGLTTVYVEVRTAYVNTEGKRRNKYKRLSTGVKINPKHWHKAKEEVTSKDPLYYDKNRTISDKYLAVQQHLGIQENQPYQAPSRAALEEVAKYFPSSTPKKALTNYIDDYIAYRKADGTPRGTWKEFLTVKNRLIKYESFIGKKLFFEDMNLVFSDNFSIWLYSKPYKPSTIEKTFTILITILNHFFARRKILVINLSDEFRERGFKKGDKQPNEANPLSYEEFVFLFNKEFQSEMLKETRDRFLLQCSTGLRHSDIDKITPSMIDDDRIVISPLKTQSTKKQNKIYIDLNKYSRRILEKYHYDTSSLKISNQKYNKNLKVMFEKLEWERRTSHNGRDTFVSICIQKRVPLEVILKWTGQSSYSILQRYIKVDDSYKRQEMHKAFD